MLIHNCFRTDLIMHSNEENDRWDDYDFEYLLNMKRYIKRQLLEKFPNPKGMKFMIERPMTLRKQIPLIMAIWDLGGILVIYDLMHCLMSNPIYKEFNSIIDACLAEYQDIEFSRLDQSLRVFDELGRLHELKYFDKDPEFENNKEDIVLATGSDLALVVNTSGTTRAPSQVYYTHEQVIQFMYANAEHFGMQPDEHMLHHRSFHHGGLCVNYLLPALATAKHHYFRIHHNQSEFFGELIKKTISEHPINRVLFPYEVTQDLLDCLTSANTLTDNFTVQSTHTIKTVDRIDQMFNSGKISRFIIMFGCGEIPGAYLLQDLTRETWPQLRENWDYTMFSETHTGFWKLKVFDEGLGIKSIHDNNNYHVPGDVFEPCTDGRWHWLGRNTQIKKEGFIIFPAAVEELFKKEFAKFDSLIIPDYEHKKIYAVVFKNINNIDDNVLLDMFNEKIDKEINPRHRLDLVLTLDKTFIDGMATRAPSMSAARFLARKKLGLDTSL